MSPAVTASSTVVNVQDSSDSEDESLSIDAPDYSSLSSGGMDSPSDVSSDESDDETGAQTSTDPDECEINIVSL